MVPRFRRLLAVTFLSALPLYAQQKPAPKPAPPLLPQSFAGWKMTAPAHMVSTVQAADTAHAAILDEDGFKQLSAASYSDAKANTAAVRAYRFSDATGAYAAYTAFRDPAMHPVRIGSDGVNKLDNGATGGLHTLFWSGATLVDVTFSKDEPTAVQELTALAATLPPAVGSAAIAPPLPTYLPVDARVPGSIRYSIGPAAYAASGSPVPAQVIDFSRDAEVVTGTYKQRSGAEGKLTLVMYPTPQMAVNRERALGSVQGGLGAGFTEKRLVPMLAYTTGDLSKAEAGHLIDSIRYKTEVILNQPQGYVSEVAKAAKLLLGIGYLTLLLGVAAVVLAIFLGAGRVIVRRLRGKPISSMNDDDFISLKIDS